MAKNDGITIAAILTYLVILLLNIAWIGVLIWAVIFVVTHIGGWIG